MSKNVSPEDTEADAKTTSELVSLVEGLYAQHPVANPPNLLWNRYCRYAAALYRRLAVEYRQMDDEGILQALEDTMRVPALTKPHSAEIAGDVIEDVVRERFPQAAEASDEVLDRPGYLADRNVDEYEHLRVLLASAAD